MLFVFGKRSKSESALNWQVRTKLLSRTNFCTKSLRDESSASLYLFFRTAAKTCTKSEYPTSNNKQRHSSSYCASIPIFECAQNTDQQLFPLIMLCWISEIAKILLGKQGSRAYVALQKLNKRVYFIWQQSRTSTFHRVSLHLGCWNGSGCCRDVGERR